MASMPNIINSLPTYELTENYYDDCCWGCCPGWCGVSQIKECRNSLSAVFAFGVSLLPDNVTSIPHLYGEIESHLMAPFSHFDSAADDDGHTNTDRHKEILTFI